MRFIKVGQVINLEEPNKNSILLQSTVEKVEKDRLFIKLPKDSDIIRNKISEGDELNCRLYTQFGVYLFFSMVLDVQANYIVIDYNPDEYRLLDRREFIRIDMKIPAMLEYKGKYIRVMTIDIGGGGIKFLSYEDLPVNSYMNMKIIFDKDDSSVRVCGKILKNEKLKENEYLFFFDDIDENLRTKIIGKCIEEQASQVREFLDNNHESSNK